ncbi:ATP-binding protein [Streptomyces griseoluteus]|uniref:ATP-binding protein n=1 Tax=Streptomyces griseoluteus TaxID=29306 RepID=UPI0033EE3B41
MSPGNGTPAAAGRRFGTPPATGLSSAEAGRRLVRHGPNERLSVTDDGPGVPPELLAHVFGRFTRGDTSRARATGSTGVGLTVVDAVARAHEGRAEAHSTVGRTCFTLVLPLTDDHGGTRRP